MTELYRASDDLKIGGEALGNMQTYNIYIVLHTYTWVYEHAQRRSIQICKMLFCRLRFGGMFGCIWREYRGYAMGSLRYLSKAFGWDLDIRLNVLRVIQPINHVMC